MALRRIVTRRPAGQQSGRASFSATRSPGVPRPDELTRSLLEDKQGASGLMYRRNRYYDPGSGCFTQEDPIGLAGGLNLYGFANGDPVNFSDPFGLCAPWPDCLLQGATDWGAQRGGALGSAVLNGAAAANAAAEAFGANELGQAVADGDAVGGAIALAGMLPVGRAAKAGRPALGAVKGALAEVHGKVGKLPKGAPGKFGSPQRGNATRDTVLIRLTPVPSQVRQRKAGTSTGGTGRVGSAAVEDGMALSRSRKDGGNSHARHKA